MKQSTHKFTSLKRKGTINPEAKITRKIRSEYQKEKRTLIRDGIENLPSLSEWLKIDQV